jgi:uncharacterized protein
MLKSSVRNPDILCLARVVTRFRRVALIAPGAMIMHLAPALALDDSEANTGKSVPLSSFASGQAALRVAEEDLRAGKIEASVAPLTYAAESGQVIARWKLGQMYAKGEGVPRDDSKAYYYFNQLVEGYDEDQPNLGADASAIADAFVAVGVYCLSGIPNSDVGPDRRRAYELFQYAATTFANPNAQYNLAHMYMIGGNGLAKDSVAALRWLALAAKAGHPPSEALLGHMLFVGDAAPNQRARGLMWLELAKASAPDPQGKWIRDLYQRDTRNASDTERLMAASMLDARIKVLDARTKIALPALAARNNTTSLLQPFDVLPPDR